MYLTRIGRALCVVSVTFWCVSCGGGGGGSSGTPSSTPPPSGGTPPPGQQQPPGPLPTFSVSGTTFSFVSEHPNVTPASQRIPMSINGIVNGTLYLQSSSDNGTFASASMTYTGGSGQQPTIDAFVSPAASSTLLAGTYSTTITLTACVNDSTCATGQLPGSPQTINVTYTLRSDAQGDVVGPRVVTAGEPGTAILHGRGLSGATQVSFGGVAATDVSVSSLNSNEVRAKFPALAAGTYPLTINGGAIPFTASLVAVARPNFAATQLLYPSTPQEIGGITYDAERRAIYVAARYADSQANTLFKFQYDGSAWQAPAAVKVAGLQDVALSADGSTVLLATDTSVVELDVATLAPKGTYSASDDLIRAGTAYIQGIAVVNDGYAIVTTGGANPSNALLYSPTTHTFATINSAGSNGTFGGAASQFYFANVGVSLNGSLAVLSQDPRTAAALPNLVTRPFLYLYSATQSQRGSLFASPSSPFTDKDRSQSGRSAKPAVWEADGVVAGTKIVVHGPIPTVVSADYSARGSLPVVTRATVFNTDGTRVYAFDAPAGTENGELRAYDVTARLNPSTQTYAPIGTGVPLSPGSGTGVIAMTLTPDGGNVFIVGTAGVFVQPSPL